MTLFDKRCNCIGLSVIASLILGIITAFLRITAVISVSPVFLAVLFGIVVIYLAVLLAGALLGDKYISCTGSCYSLTAVLTGILGTILTSVILFAISFVATSVIGAIITGALIFFFALTISATACLVKYLVYNRD